MTPPTIASRRPPLTVTITGPRGDEWERVCGLRAFPVTTFNPIRASVLDRTGVEVWMVNLPDVNVETLQRIIAHLAVKFGLPIDEMRWQVERAGIPILAEDAYVVLNDPQRWI